LIAVPRPENPEPTITTSWCALGAAPFREGVGPGAVVAGIRPSER